MKKTICILILVCALSQANGVDKHSWENGIFVGAFLNWGLKPDSLVSDTINAGANKTQIQKQISFGMAKVGFLTMPTKYFGLRGYYSFGATKLTQDIVHTQTIGGGGSGVSRGAMDLFLLNHSANLDLILAYDIVQNFRVAVFGGVGYEWISANDKSTKVLGQDVGLIDSNVALSKISGNGLVFNVGIQSTISKSHQIELGAKIPNYNIKSQTNWQQQNNSQIGEKTIKSPIVLYVGYSFLFNL